MNPPPEIEHRSVGGGFLSVLRCAPAVRNDNGCSTRGLVNLSFRAGGTAGAEGRAGAVERGEKSPADMR
jgi:hypothetical protein